ncbi:MAG: ribosome recycling factor [Proteobacteria bacterium]|nr:ribosome recycling factor [Desulfobulbaceae bacterium]MBU4153029.1 ribosome recycling factor [Pseudomonadota bacterium]MDP2105332.1 ribosome recycling factor [Desulfobulbaceae bacterium]
MDQIISEMRDKMAKSIEAYRRELTKIRTGRASLSIFDGIKVESYGSKMPLNQVASITIPESRMIVIQPWDTQLINVIDKAILKANIGLNPVSDGKVIRLSIPQLTEDRRKDLVKQVKKIGEEFKVAVRNNRRDAIDIAKKMKKDKEISEDDLFTLQDSAQKETDAFIKQIDDSMAEKEKEVMEV